MCINEVVPRVCEGRRNNLCDLIQVLVNSEFTINWSVPRAAKSDRIGACTTSVEVVEEGRGGEGERPDLHNHLTEYYNTIY